MNEGLDLLIVEDDADTRANLCDILELDGHRVEAVPSLSRALDRQDWSGLDAIILDRKLPDGMAEQSLPRLRQLAPAAAIMIVTAYADLDGAIAALRNGAQEYILKPVSADVLRNSLRRIADRRRIELERREAQEALHRERDFAEGLIETAQAIVLVLDTEGRIVRLNRYLEDLTGYSRHELTGKDCFETLIIPSERPKVRELFRQALREHAARGSINRIVAKDGTEREVAWWDKTLKDAQGHILGVLAVGHDLTELREAQHQAVQAERLAAIGQMVAGLAHESRNALQRSQACLEMLELEVADRPAARDLVARIQRAQDHLHHLYEEVRGFAAPILLHRRVVDLADVWREAWHEVTSGEPDRTARLQERSAGVDLRCEVDPFSLGQVFRNMFENSLAACAGAVQITIRAHADELASRGALRISVTDNGPGLTPDQKKRIFEPFFTTKTQGTGLGMAIARRIVEAHSGRIDVGDASSGGAEIVIILPRGSVGNAPAG